MIIYVAHQADCVVEFVFLNAAKESRYNEDWFVPSGTSLLFILFITLVNLLISKSSISWSQEYTSRISAVQ